MMQAFGTWKRRARQLKRETYAVYLALKDPRVPWYARLVAGLVVAYAFSPIDLIPDFIPVLGYLDDLVLLPLGIALTIRLLPPDILAACRAHAAEALVDGIPTNWTAALVIIAIWVVLALWVAAAILRYVWS